MQWRAEGEDFGSGQLERPISSAWLLFRIGGFCRGHCPRNSYNGSFASRVDIFDCPHSLYIYSFFLVVTNFTASYPYNFHFRCIPYKYSCDGRACKYYSLLPCVLQQHFAVFLRGRVLVVASLSTGCGIFDEERVHKPQTV